MGWVYLAYAAVSAMSATIDRNPEHGSATSTANGCAPSETIIVPCCTTLMPKPRSSTNAVLLAKRRRWIVTASR